MVDNKQGNKCTSQVILHSPIGTTVTVVRVSNEQHCSWKCVLRHCDGVTDFGENRSVVINVCNSDVDLGGAVNRTGVGEGLENQQDVRLRLVVQRFDVADQARLGMNGEQSLKVSR